MKIHLILIGSELLNGKLQDKNAQWLARYTHQRHRNLSEVTMVPDHKESLFKVLDKATFEADIILTSGCLGPTLDDLTKPLLAEYFQKKMIDNQNEV